LTESGSRQAGQALVFPNLLAEILTRHGAGCSAEGNAVRQAIDTALLPIIGWAANLFTSEDWPIGFAFVRALFGPAPRAEQLLRGARHTPIRDRMDIELAVLRPVYEGESRTWADPPKDRSHATEPLMWGRCSAA
jgi:hypothetical protein